MTKPVLVVMAAGVGSRYGGSKQTDPIGRYGQLMIDYSIYDARRAGFETVVFVIKREMEGTFKAAIGDRLSEVMEVKYAYQALHDLPAGYGVPEGRFKPWGTAHAVLAARHVVSGPFAVINADDYYGPSGFKAIYGYLLSHPGEGVQEYAMAGFRLGNTISEHGSVARSVCSVDENHFLTKLEEHTNIEKTGIGIRSTKDGGETWIELSAGAIVSMNLWGLTSGFLDEAWARFPAFLDKNLTENPWQAEYYLPAVISQLIYEGKARVKVLQSTDEWFGVTYREDKPAVAAAIAEKTRIGLYPENLWEVGK